MSGQWLGKENHLMLADRQNLALDVSESKGQTVSSVWQPG
jgi:hypothetical protein